MSQMSAFSPTREVMPTLSAMTSGLPWPTATEIIAGAVILLLLWMCCRRTVEPGMAGAAAAACGLLVSHHALFADTAILIPLAVLIIQKRSEPSWLKVWAVLMLSPAPFLVAAAWHNSLFWQALVVPFVITAVSVARVSGDPC
jgi:hypothetical protein